MSISNEWLCLILLFLLSSLRNQLGKGKLPGIHLDDLDAVDDLVHDSDTFVCLEGSFHSEFGEDSSHPT